MKAITVITIVIFALLGVSSLHSEENKIKIKGDFRYRHETIDEDGSDTRNRHRMRARIGLSAQVNENIGALIQISSGSSDPVSNNQSLDEGFSSKDINLDLAYFSWKPRQLNGLELFGGKMKNPFYCVQKSELLWDPDLNPEGLAGRFAYDVNMAKIFIGAGFFWIEESAGDDDSYIAGVQTRIEYIFPDRETYMIAGMGFYNFLNTQGFEPFYDAEDSSGNSLDFNGNYSEDYDELDFFAEFGTMIRSLPVAIFGDLVTNTAAKKDDLGWLVGISLGKTENPGSWKVRYQYKYQEKDAVVGVFTDSDFIGGGTNGRGHELNFDYMVMKNTTFAVTYFITQKNLDDEKDYNRLQVDLKLAF